MPADAKMQEPAKEQPRVQQPQPAHDVVKKPADDEMYCSNCNAIISRDAVICYSCGQRVETPSANDDQMKKVIKKRVA